MQFPAFPGMVKNRSKGDVDLFVGKMQAAGLDPTNVAAIIEFESAGSWSPAKQGPKAFSKAPGYAVGLIQFSPDTAESLGTSTAELERMSFADQLDYVVKYFQRIAPNRLKRLQDYYAAVFWPSAIGTSDDYVIAEAGSPTYEANAGLDHGKKGRITTSDLATTMQAMVARARGAGEVTVSPRTGAAPLAVAVALVGLGTLVTVAVLLLNRRGPR